MIVNWILSGFSGFLTWILGFFPELLSSDIARNILSYVQHVISFGGDLFFLLVPKDAFLVALDVLTAWAIHEPFVRMTIWCLKKIPFLGIN